VIKELLVIREQQDIQVQLVILVVLVILELQAMLVIKVLKEQLEQIQQLLEHKAILDQQVQKVLQAQQVLMVHKVLKVIHLEVSKETAVHKEHRDLFQQAQQGQ